MPKAWVLKSIGEIEYTDVEMPLPKANEVRIRVMAAGVCGSDIPRIYETGAHKMPLIPGHEFSGVVEEVGEGTDPGLIGKRVSVFPKIACGKCDMCMGGKPGSCRNYDYVGSRRDGAFAEYVTAPCDNLLELPDNVSFEEAAMMEPFAVAANAVRTGTSGIDKDRPVAVCGLGTIGLMVTMLLKEAGYGNIFVIGNKSGQKRRSSESGVPESRYFDASAGDPSEWLLNASAGGLDVYFECIGKNETITNGIKTLSPGGKLILVGNPYSDMEFPKDVWWKILRDQMTVTGIWNSSFDRTENDDWNYILKRLSLGKLRPDVLISHRFEPGDLEKGFLIMRDKTEDYCKIMMKL